VMAPRALHWPPSLWFAKDPMISRVHFPDQLHHRFLVTAGSNVELVEMFSVCVF
jgi:hypothetical protein